MMNPVGTGNPALARIARFAPFPPEFSIEAAGEVSGRIKAAWSVMAVSTVWMSAQVILVHFEASLLKNGG
jgi:hypothetical protein